MHLLRRQSASLASLSPPPYQKGSSESKIKES